MNSAIAAETPKVFNIEQQHLATALNQFAQQSDRQILFSTEVVKAKRSSGIKGELAPEIALRRLLEGTGLSFRITADNTILVDKPGDTAHVPVLNSMRLARAGGSANASRNEAQETSGNSQASAQEGIELEEIVVTGSHIRGVEAAGTKVLTIDREQIEHSGYGRVEDVLATLTQNYKGTSEEARDQPTSNLNYGAEIQLRGLGPGTTLTLVNGMRQAAGGVQGVFVDVSSIPLAAIERVEVLTDGASAVYGSDAIGGVVNIILREDFEGAETRVRAGTAKGEADELQLSQVAGTTWNGVNALAGYQYLKRDTLPAAAREYTARNWDMTAYGGTDFRASLRRYQGSPGTILCPAGRPGCPSGTPAFAIPAGQDGTDLTVADLVPGGVNYADEVTNTDLLPEQEMHSVFLNASANLSDTWRLNGVARYSDREADRNNGPRRVTVTVPNTNPFYVNAFGNNAPLRVAYDLAADFGPVAIQTETKTTNIALGATHQLSGSWQMRFTTSFAREEAGSSLDFVDTADPAITAALNAALADPDPATALNVFGSGGNNNPATLDKIRSRSFTQGISEVWMGGAMADGAVFEMPGGKARLGVGVEYRNEDQIFVNTTRTSTRRITDGRHVAAAFTELSLPLVGERNSFTGAHRLNLSMAGRFEDYSDFGQTLDPKLGLTFMPIPSLAFRGTWGTSFRAPPFNASNTELFRTIASGEFVRDPAAPGGTSKTITLYGSNPDLQEETADVWTAGIDFTPQSLPAFTASATYFAVSYRNKIEANTVDLAFEDQFAALVIRDPTQQQIDAICNDPSVRLDGDCIGPISAIVDSRQRNTARVKVRGIDFDVSHGVQTRLGGFRYSLGGTYTLTYDRAIAASAPLVSVVDTVRYPLALRMRGSLGWNLRNYSAGLTVNHWGSYSDPSTTPARRVDAQTTVDVNLGYVLRSDSSWLDNTRLFLSAINVSDELPPFVNQFDGYDAANATLLGRSVSFQVTKSF